MDRALERFEVGMASQAASSTPAEPPAHWRALGDINTVREKGVEPSRLASPEPKSGASANSATRARDPPT